MGDSKSESKEPPVAPTSEPIRRKYPLKGTASRRKAEQEAQGSTPSVPTVSSSSSAAAPVTVPSNLLQEKVKSEETVPNSEERERLAALENAIVSTSIPPKLKRYIETYVKQYKNYPEPRTRSDVPETKLSEEDDNGKGFEDAFMNRKAGRIPPKLIDLINPPEPSISTGVLETPSSSPGAPIGVSSSTATPLT
jgi:hypothetical protein